MGLEDAVDAVERDLDGLFDDDVLACLGGLDSRFHVGAAGGGDGDDVDGGVLEHVGVVAVDLAAGELLGELRNALVGPGAAGDELGVGQLLDRLGVKVADEAGTDDAEVVGFGHRVVSVFWSSKTSLIVMAGSIAFQKRLVSGGKILLAVLRKGNMGVLGGILVVST